MSEVVQEEVVASEEVVPPESEQPEEEVINNYNILLELVRRQYVSVVWTSKMHEKQAEIYAEKYRKLETANVVFAALTSCGIGSTFLTESMWAKLLAILCSFITVAITTYYKSFDIKRQSATSKSYANQFVIVRNDLLQIIADLHRKRASLDEIEDSFHGVMDRINKLYADAPPTSEKAEKRAEVDLRENSTYAMSSADVDKLLPPALRGYVTGEQE